MLVLTRMVNERIMIDGGRIVITIVRVQGEKVRVGIDAPPDVDVHREEIFNLPPEQRKRPPTA
mgnify:CR=1 FL=1